MDDEKLATTFFHYLLHYDYQKIISFLDQSSQEVRDKLYYWIDDATLMSRIANKKNIIGDIILKESVTEHEDEDNDRVVFLLAKLVNSTFKSAVESFRSEFGDAFVLKEQYLIGGKDRSWKDLALKSKQIKNAFRNFDMIKSKQFVDGIFHYYLELNQADPKKLQRIVDLADIFLIATQRAQFTQLSKNEIDSTRSGLSELLELCGWLKIDIDKLESLESFEDYVEFVSNIQMACVAKLYLIYNNLPVDDHEAAKMALLKYFANDVALSYRGDSIARMHLKLKPAGV